MSGLEGLSIGANVVGVLVFGLQAAKFIAESVSKYQDVEDDHRRFLDAIQRLAGVLTDVNEILKADEDKLRYSRLYTVAKKCEADLVKIHGNILEWTGSTSGKKSKTVRTWKKFKLIFLGDNSKRWLESLESHYGFILFQLNRIQLDDRKEQKAAVGRIESNLAHVSDTISNIEDTQVETLVRMDKVESSVTRQIQTHSTAVQDLTASVGVNFNQVNGTLGSISSLVQLFANTEFHKHSQEREQDELEKATGRIFRLSAAAVTRRKATIQKEQTEEVLGDIRKIIDFAKSGQFSDLSTAQATENPQQKNRKLAGLLAGTEALSIGYDHQDFAALLSRSNQPKTSTTSICQWDQDGFSLRVSENLQCDVPEGKRQLGSPEFSRRVTKITYLPKTNGISSIIDIYLAQPQGPGASIYTGLSFRAILPNDAEILVAIYSGSLEGVRRLVSTKQANVNDCDLWGQSLLTVSLMKAQYTLPDSYSELDVAQLAKNRLEITKYLISQGSDVTSIDSENYDPLSAAKSWGNNEGVALLLENGGNPVIRPDTILSFARQLDEYAVHEIWQAPYLYDHSSTYSRMYYHLPNYDLKSVVRKLVSSGADPTGRCPEGENCLHLVLNSTLVPECIPTEDGPARLKDLLLFLVGEFGFDVRAKTNDGFSVSDYAFGARCPTGRCIGPIWIEVLMELGYDPLEVAEGSIYFAHIKQFMVSKPIDFCFCQTCQLADEHDYIHIFRHGEDIANSSTTSECYIEDHGENDITASNGIDLDACGDFEFFEKLSLGNGFNEECKTSYDASGWMDYMYRRGSGMQDYKLHQGLVF
ncbi:hypothetical protein TWF173_006633 [Orbilia oligospora]|nr:hypothetical protein TWF173_006633 [Orbilia oligospora]